MSGPPVGRPDNRNGGPENRFELSLVLPRDAASIPVARHLCQAALEELGCRSEATADLALAVTEACANVVAHAGPGDAYTVDISLDAESCELRILDSGGSFETEAVDASVTERARDPMSESGRGLAIIRALTDHLSFEAVPDSGTLVRMVKRVDFANETPAHQLLARSDP